jgi:RNA polymerase sigma-70 factor, ECF subfamily
MDRYCDGDRRAFEGLHAALTPRLRGYLIKLVRDEATADDLLQLTFLKAHLARERFCVLGGDPDGAVQGWYFAIGRNVALDHLRQQGRRERREELGRLDPAWGEAGAAEIVDDAASVEQLAVAHEHSATIIERVHEALAQLPPGQREVVELHKLQGLSMAEIAERLAIREGAARVRAHRGYKALARLLGAATALALLGLGLKVGLGLLGSSHGGFGG